MPIATPCAAVSIVAAPASAPSPAPAPPAPAQSPVTVSTSDSCEEQVVSSNSSAGSTAELLGENERLRLENLQLNKELSQMKNLCGNIYGMMSNYAQSSNSGNQSSESSSPALKQLDLLRTERSVDESQQVKAVGDDESRAEPEEVHARLFGFSIGVKRVREGEEAVAEHAQDLRLQQPGTDVKPEPSDLESNGDNEETSWLIHCGGRNQRACN